LRPTQQSDIRRPLFISAFVIATCGLVYELIAGAMASYLLGDSITQFSLIIGVYLSSMGLGAYASRYISDNLLSRFVEIEIAIALVGGFEAIALFAAFAYTPNFQAILFSLVSIVGMLVGMELPLLIRILEDKEKLKDLVARVFFLDYIGALVASLSFPLVLAPRLGLLRTSLAFGILNVGVALWTTFLFQSRPAEKLRLRAMGFTALALLAICFGLAQHLEKKIDADLFSDPVVLHYATPYQKLTFTRRGPDLRLYINGALQFSSIDEYRYHESLVHPAMASVDSPERVLVMGGGDGMAVREVLKHPAVRHVSLVELDPQMTGLFQEREELVELNGGSLSDPRVRIINADAFHWLREWSEPERYDVVIIDFPDPNNYSLGKLYTNYFYRMLRRVIDEGGAVGIQSTSPVFSPAAYWCIMETLEHEGYMVRPYRAYVPAFGEWGFALASPSMGGSFSELPPGLRYLNADTMETLFVIPADLGPREVPINRLDNQSLVRLYEEDWQRMLSQ
jgi:spermidine synthase